MKRRDWLAQEFAQLGLSLEEADKLAVKSHCYMAQLDQRIAAASDILRAVSKDPDFVTDVLFRWGCEVPEVIGEWLPNRPADAAFMRIFACLGIEMLIQRKFYERYHSGDDSNGAS